MTSKTNEQNYKFGPSLDVRDLISRSPTLRTTSQLFLTIEITKGVRVELSPGRVTLLRKTPSPRDS